MNLLFSCIGKRGYIASLFRDHLAKDDRIIGTSNTRWTSGFHACDASYIMPNITDPGYIDAMLDLCHRENIDGLLSFFDLDVYYLSAHRDSFAQEGIKTFIPQRTAAEISFDKVQTYEFLMANGFCTARTFTNIDTVHEAVKNCEIDFPLWVKPRWGFGSKNTFQAQDMHQLKVFFNLEADMIVQTTLGGTAFNFDILNDLEGRVVSVVPWHRSLSTMGETQEAETVEAPELLEVGERLASSLSHAGPLDADLFVDKDGVHVLEINLRFGGGYPVSHLAGAGFPEKIIRMVRGEIVEPSIGNYQRGVVMMKELRVLGGPIEEFFHETLSVVENDNV
jgi:carbamoyl-phosphate synthase large subunit